MKILWISHFIPYPPKAGLIIRSLGLIKELSNEHEVELFMFNQPRLMSGFYQDIDNGTKEAIKELEKYSKISEVLNIPSEQSRFSRLWLIVRSFFSFTPYTINWLQSPEATLKLTKVLSERDYDLIHFDTISLDTLFDATRSSSAPKVLDHHNIESHMMQRRANLETNILKKLYLSWEARKLVKYEKLALKHYDAHITCSNDDNSRLLELEPDANSAVIPNGIDISNSSTSYTPDGSNSILFVGGLSWYPNLEGILFVLEKVLPILDQKGCRYQFNVVGGGVPSELQKKYANNPKVNLLGFVDDVAPLFSTSSVFIAPIFDGGGTKLKILDALSNHIPLVTTTLGCEGIDIKHEEHCLIADTADDIASQIMLAIENPALSQQLVTNGAKIVREHYSYEEVGKKLRSFYSSLV